MKDKKRVLTILLTLIIIIVLLLGVVMIFGGMRNAQVEDFQQTVEKAACNYAENTLHLVPSLCIGYENLCKIHYDKLINNDYLDSDLINPLTKEKTKDNTSDYIQITWENDKMICTYKEG